MLILNNLKIKRYTRNSILAYIYLSPVLLHLLIFKFYPVILSFVKSMYRNSFLDPDKLNFIGLGNYFALFQDETFWNSIWITLKFNFLINPIQILISFIMALIISQNIRGKSIYRLLFFVPLGVSLSVAVLYGGIIFRPEGGPMNYILLTLGLEAQPFYSSAQQATWVIIAIASWKGCSFWMLFLYAGLKNISTEVIEAAKIDGANTWQHFKYMTLPLMKRPLVFVLVADTTANFLLFIPIYMLTHGGPNDSTNVLIYEAYNTLLEGDTGYATAMNTILIILLVIILSLQFYILREKK